MSTHGFDYQAEEAEPEQEPGAMPADDPDERDRQEVQDSLLIPLRQ